MTRRSRRWPLCFGVVEVSVAGLLGDDVEGAAGGAAAVDGRGRAAQDLDLLGEKFSRMLTAGSRMPSTKTSLRASKPRMKKRSPKALPPSPVPSVTPAVVRADLLQARGVLVLENFLGEDCDGLRRVDDRLAEFRRSEPIRLVGRCGIGIGILIGRLRGRLAGAGAGLACAACFARAARRKALRTRNCSAVGLVAGRLFARDRRFNRHRRHGDCAFAPVIEATAIRQPIVTLRVELSSSAPSLSTRSQSLNVAYAALSYHPSDTPNLKCPSRNSLIPMSCFDSRVVA